MAGIGCLMHTVKLSKWHTVWLQTTIMYWYAHYHLHLDQKLIVILHFFSTEDRWPSWLWHCCVQVGASMSQQHWKAAQQTVYFPMWQSSYKLRNISLQMSVAPLSTLSTFTKFFRGCLKSFLFWCPPMTLCNFVVPAQWQLLFLDTWLLCFALSHWVAVIYLKYVHDCFAEL